MKIQYSKILFLNIIKFILKSFYFFLEYKIDLIGNINKEVALINLKE